MAGEGVPCFIRKFLSQEQLATPGDHMELVNPRVKPASGEQSQETGVPHLDETLELPNQAG